MLEEEQIFGTLIEVMRVRKIIELTLINVRHVCWEILNFRTFTSIVIFGDLLEIS